MLASGGNTASSGETIPEGRAEAAAELEPDLRSLLTNDEVLDFDTEGKAGSAECGGTGKGGTGGISEEPIGAPIGMKLTEYDSALGSCLVDILGLVDGDETAVALEDVKLPLTTSLEADLPRRIDVGTRELK